MDELNGKIIACQILITGLIARVANESRDPLRFLINFRDEIKAVVKGINIAGMDNTDRVRKPPPWRPRRRLQPLRNRNRPAKHWMTPRRRRRRPRRPIPGSARTC